MWRIRNLLTWLIVIVCLALMAITWWPKTRFIYESRPVSNAHAMFNDNCGVCHVESFQPARRLLRGDASVRSVLDEKCCECHHVSPHHEECVPDPNCATCHQEHRGRPVLARVADSHCTVCHADLNTVGGSRSGFATKVSGFTTNHPPFGARPGGKLVDDGTVRFNHQVHLDLITRPESVRGIDKPLAALQALRCHYCHELDDKPDAARRYMKPINYDKHCSQCHALTVGVATNGEEEKAPAAAQRFMRDPAPHKDPLTVRAVLGERYTRFVVDNPVVLGSLEPAEPPRWIGSPPRAQPITDKQGCWVNEQLRTAERILFDGANGCRYCHEVQVARGPGNLPQYAAPGIKAVWFRHSIFSHERHRMKDCAECHAAASSSNNSKDVLLPTIGDCRECHNSQGGARTDCAECHRYHDRTREVFRGRNTVSGLTQKQ